jgi:hypothetical protein
MLSGLHPAALLAILVLAVALFVLLLRLIYTLLLGGARKLDLWEKN